MTQNMLVIAKSRLGIEEQEHEVEVKVFSEAYQKGVVPSGWTLRNASYLSHTFEDGYMEMYHLSGDPNTTFMSYAIKQFDFELARDNLNNTRLLSGQRSGKIAIEIDFEANINTDRATATYMQLSFGTRVSDPESTVWEFLVYDPAKLGSYQ